MHWFSIILLSYIGALSAHQGLHVVEDMFEAINKGGTYITLNNGVCLVDQNFSTDFILHQHFSFATSVVTASMNGGGFMLGKDFYFANDAAFMRNLHCLRRAGPPNVVTLPSSSAHHIVAMAMPSDRSLGQSSLLAYATPPALLTNPMQEHPLLSFPGHENLNVTHTHSFEASENLISFED